MTTAPELSHKAVKFSLNLELRYSFLLNTSILNFEKRVLLKSTVEGVSSVNYFVLFASIEVIH